MKKQNPFDVRVDTKRQIANAIMGYNDGLQTSQITPKDRDFLLSTSGIQTLLTKRLNLKPRLTQVEADDDDDDDDDDEDEDKQEIVATMEEVD